ncbi:MAG: DUF1992 domain-containing protein [Rubrivivax sp.]|nr:DUF1992 domain-containing protein [Rubrivivax sp.]
MNAEERRLQRLQTLDEQIAAHLRDSAARGKLQSAPSWGRPLPPDEGYEQTPSDLRMPFKILKDAGVVPPEVELMHRIAQLQQAAAACLDDAERQGLQQRAAELRQHLALRLERLRRTGSL